MFLGSRIASPGRLAALFVGLTALPLVALGWLGFQFSNSQDLLELQQRQDQLDRAAELVAAEIERTLVNWATVAARALEIATITPPDGTALVVLGDAGVVRTGGVTLPFLPTPDGKNIVLSVARRDRTFEIAIVSAETGAYRSLRTLDSPDGANRMALSPDGTLEGLFLPRT